MVKYAFASAFILAGLSAALPADEQQAGLLPFRESAGLVRWTFRDDNSDRELCGRNILAEECLGTIIYCHRRRFWPGGAEACRAKRAKAPWKERVEVSVGYCAIDDDWSAMDEACVGTEEWCDMELYNESIVELFRDADECKASRAK